MNSDCCPKVVFIDLDGTLWKHRDVSITTPPYTKISDDAVVDANGVLIELFNGATDFLKELKNLGLKVFSLSWNNRDIAIQLLNVFGLSTFFDGHYIEQHPFKDRLMLRALKDLEAAGLTVKPCEIVYIDDRTIHLKRIYTYVGNVKFIHMWIRYKSFREVLAEISNLMTLCKKRDTYNETR